MLTPVSVWAKCFQQTLLVPSSHPHSTRLCPPGCPLNTALTLAEHIPRTLGICAGYARNVEGLALLAAAFHQWQMQTEHVNTPVSLPVHWDSSEASLALSPTVALCDWAPSCPSRDWQTMCHSLVSTPAPSHVPTPLLMFPHDSLSQNPILGGPKQRHSCNSQTQHLSGELSEILISLLPQPVQVTQETVRSFRDKGSSPLGNLHLLDIFPSMPSGADTERETGRRIFTDRA